jgi:hypothetical protein
LQNSLTRNLVDRSLLPSLAAALVLACTLLKEYPPSDQSKPQATQLQYQLDNKSIIDVMTLNGPLTCKPLFMTSSNLTTTFYKQLTTRSPKPPYDPTSNHPMGQ